MEGFKAGIEIHQQLAGRKLFAPTPTTNTDKTADMFTSRKLRAVVGETGIIDVAAAHEMSKSKSFKYQSHSSDTSLVEFDEEPPHDANPAHVQTAIIVAKMLNCKIVDEIQMMRKTVIDGSNVSGFQRTMLIGYDGYVQTSKGKVAIPTVLLEEEAAQKVSDSQTQRTYKLDRLGIPLLEISTDASLQDPQHVKETAGIIGMFLRSTDKIKRGLGTIRQDVNVSIKGGYRVEVKGFQDLKSIPKVIKKEIARQQEEIKSKNITGPHVRKAESDMSTTFLRPMPGAARLYPETDILPIRITEQMLDVKLPELLDDKIAKIKESSGLDEGEIKILIKNELLELFQEIAKDLSGKDAFSIIYTTPQDLKSRQKLDITKLTQENYKEVVSKIKDNTITKDKAADVLAIMIEGKDVDYTQFKSVDSSELRPAIEEIVKEKPGLNPGAYMGLIMKKFNGKVDGKAAMIILKELL